MRQFSALLLTLTMVGCAAKQQPPRTPQPPPSAAPSAMEVAAPAAPANVKPGEKFSIAAEHDGKRTTHYRFTQNGTVVDSVPVSALSNGVIQRLFASGVSEGSYKLGVRAVRVLTAGQQELTSDSWTTTVVAGQPLVVSWVAMSDLPSTVVPQQYRLMTLTGLQPLATMPAAGLQPGASFNFPAVTTLPPGPVTLEVRADVNVTALSELVSPEAVIDVVSGTPVVDSITTDATQYVAGAPVTVTWSAASPAPGDWVGIFDVNTNATMGKTATNGAQTGKTTMPAPSPTVVSFYYARYCRADGFCPFVSASFPVSPAVTNTDCVGSWSPWVPTSEWSACVAGSQARTEQSTYTITQPATGNGKACEATNGQVRTQTVKQACTVDQDCQGTWSAPLCGTCTNGVQTCSRTFTITQEPSGNGKACPVSPEVTKQACTVTVLPPTLSGCTWPLTFTPPDSTLGWRAQLRENDVPRGNRDNTAPYSRTVTVGLGTFKYDVEWSKTNTGPKVISSALTLVCGK